MKNSMKRIIIVIAVIFVHSITHANVWIYCPSDICDYGSCPACNSAFQYEDTGSCCFNCWTLGIDPYGMPQANWIVINWPEGISIASCCGLDSCYYPIP